MSETTQSQEPTQTINIVAHSLYDFCKDIQNAFLQGYRFDLDKSEYAPISYGHMQTCTMVLSNCINEAVQINKQAVENITEVVTDIVSDASTQTLGLVQETAVNLIESTDKSNADLLISADTEIKPKESKKTKKQSTEGNQ